VFGTQTLRHEDPMMRAPIRWLLASALLGLPTVSVPAQTAAADSAAIIRLEDGWAKALVKRDAAFFQRTLAPGFVYTEDDRLMSRADVLRDAVSGTDTVTASHNEGMVVHSFGSTGVVTGILVIEGRSGGKPFVHRYRFTDTWVRQKGGWQIVAAQDYLIPAARR